MSWSEATLEGFALGVAAAGTEARVPIDAAVPAVAEELKRLLGTWRELEPGARKARMASAAGRMGRVPNLSAPMPLRARALLAAEVDRETGQRWLDQVPATRRGFAPGSGLRGAIRACAVVASVPPRPVANMERTVGRALLARMLSGWSEPARRTLLRALGPAEADGVLAVEGAGAGELTSLERVLCAVARASVPGRQLTRALGAMQLGATGDLQGDGRSTSWRRAGKETAELGPWPV